MEQKSLKKNAFYSVLKAFLSLVFPLITFPYASRILLPEGIGKVNFANSVVSYFIVFGSLGITGYATREAAKIKNNKEAITKLFKEIITINLFCCFIAYLLFFISLFFIPKFNLYRNLLLVCSIKIFFSVLNFDWLYSANEEFRYITLRSFIIQLLSLIYLFVFVRNENDIIHYAIFGILTTVGGNIINYFYVNRYINISYHCSLEIKKHLKSIIIFFGMNVVISIYTILDTIMLGFLSNDNEIGLYTAGIKLNHMIVSMLTAITTVLLPRLTNLNIKKDETTFNNLIIKTSNVLIILSIPMVTGLFILSKPLIILLSGDNYIDAIPTMRILAPLLFSITFGSFAGQVLSSLNKEIISFYACLFGALSNILLNVIFIPKFGSAGAAIGTIAAESIVTIFQLFFIRNYIFNKQFFKTILQVLLCSGVMGLIIQFLFNPINNNSLKILLSFISGICIYSFFLYLIKNIYFILYYNKLLNFLKTKTKNTIKTFKGKK